MSLEDRDGLIWLDGKMVPWRDATIHVLTHTLHYGLGVFEGLRAYRTADGVTAIFCLHDHIQRLFESAKIFLVSLPFTQEEILMACRQVVVENKLASCYLRPIAWLGGERLGIDPRGNRVRVAVAAWEWGSYLGEDGMAQGICVKTSSFIRHHVNSTMIHAKACGHYINSILANQEARIDGYDEALLLDSNGYVAEGAGENVFMVKNGCIYTPGLESCLSGITRDRVITIAQDFGFCVEERRIVRDELYCADEVFFTGTAAELTPVRSIDNRVVGAGKAGPISTRLQQAFFKAVRGELPQYRSWLTPVA